MNLTPEQREAGRKALLAHNRWLAISQKLSKSGHGRTLERSEYLRLSRREIQAAIIFNRRTIATYNLLGEQYAKLAKSVEESLERNVRWLQEFDQRHDGTNYAN